MEQFIETLDKICDLDHKASHKGQFFEIEIYTSSESWINKLSIGVWFVRIGQYLENLESENTETNFVLDILKMIL